MKKLPVKALLIDRTFEKEPVPSKVPALFVVHCTGGDKLVVASQVYPKFGVPPVPTTIKLPPETIGAASVGTVGNNGVAFNCTLSKSD